MLILFFSTLSQNDQKSILVWGVSSSLIVVGVLKLLYIRATVATKNIKQHENTTFL